MPVFRLVHAPLFPDPALAEADGLLAIGGDLSPQRLVAAYRQGIFPWYSDGDPILWWSPAPRLVLFPQTFHLPRRLARTLASGRFRVSADTAFAEVIRACASASGRSHNGTWISGEMQAAYLRLHRLGFAHSIECWYGDELAGGLYGVCLDQVFFGESMFTRVRDASKVTLATLVRLSLAQAIAVIDCQMTTEHLLRFGAREISREAFQALLEEHIKELVPQPAWHLS